MLPLTYTGGPLATNAYLVPNAAETAYLCFDAPQGLSAEIRAHGLKIEALILTHGHYDHVEDAVAIADEHAIPVFLHSADLELVRGNPRSASLNKISDLSGLEKLRAPWSLGGRDFTLFHIPGHSPGSVAFYEPAEARVFGGDVIFAEGIGRTSTPQAREELLAGIRRDLLSLPEETAIYPGHGPATTIGAEKGNAWFEIRA